MEEQKLIPTSQQTLYSNTLQVYSKSHQKRESMKRRLSGHQTIQELMKMMNVKSPQKETQNQTIIKPKQLRKCFTLENLANLGENNLRKLYEKDPFLKSGLKYIQKTLKQNHPPESKRSRQTSLYQNDGKINYRSYRQLQYANQQKMFEKVVHVLSRISQTSQ